MCPDHLIRVFNVGICWLVSGILPCPDCILGATDSDGSPHEGLGGCVVDPTRLPSHLAPLRPPLDFHQTDGEGLVAELVSDRVAVPEEERLRHARGEGDPKHLPGLRGYQPPLCDYILSHFRLYVNTFFENFSVGGRLRVTEGSPKIDRDGHGRPVDGHRGVAEAVMTQGREIVKGLEVEGIAVNGEAVEFNHGEGHFSSSFPLSVLTL